MRDRLIYRLISGRRGQKQVFRFLQERDCRVMREIDGIKLVCHADLIGRALAGGTLWQRDEFHAALELLQEQDRLKPGGVFVDVGANIGMHSIYAARSGRFSKVLSIEPLSDNLDLLKTNLALNHADSVTVVHEAAGAKKSQARLYRNDKNFGRSSLVDNMGDGFETVSVRPLASILKSQSVSPEKVSLCWIDVEGFEPEVVAGMADLTARKTPLVMEFTPKYLGDRKGQLVEQLEAHYSRCHVVTSGGTEPLTFKKLLTLKDQVDIAVY